MSCNDKQAIYVIRVLWPKHTQPFYVGRTRDVMRRWREHNFHYRGWTPKMMGMFHNALMHGAQFKMDVLEKGCGEQWAKEREKHWIASLKPLGNSTEGG